MLRLRSRFTWYVLFSFAPNMAVALYPHNESVAAADSAAKRKQTPVVLFQGRQQGVVRHIRSRGHYQGEHAEEADHQFLLVVPCLIIWINCVAHIQATSLNLPNEITLIADGVEVPLPPDSQGIILLNIDSYSGGAPFWATGVKKDRRRWFDHSSQEVNGGSPNLGAQRAVQPRTLRRTRSLEYVGTPHVFPVAFASNSSNTWILHFSQRFTQRSRSNATNRQCGGP
jgi:Diacylglycerol kinase accessory domain